MKIKKSIQPIEMISSKYEAQQKPKYLVCIVICFY